MLSRASRNAYSWWWASHIRTKQSKWLDQNIQDMEEKVEYILKIITEDGDSFRVRAEQYYQKRPELVNFVEDTFRGYRALAERYDHMSKDLQSANRTIAMIFPERVQMSIDEEEYENFQSNFDEYDNMVIATNSHVPVSVPVPPKQNHLPKMESVVQTMLNKKSKMPRKMMSKKGLVKIGVDDGASNVTKNSGLSKDEAVDEIEKLQKDILGFQTEKEFVKSSYESALSKYWEIEHNINEMHTKISNLQHEFAVGEAMDDHNAQTLMSTSALNMCKETLDKLKCKQKRFKTEAVVEHNRVDDIRKKFEALIVQNNNDTDLEQTTELHVKDKKAKIEEKELKIFEENGTLVQQEHEKEIMRTSEKVTVSEVAEKIEQLVDKVITLETDLSSQTALVMRLRFEIDELHEKVQSLEQENKNLVDESNSKNIKIKKLEEELERVQMLDKQINVQNVQLETSFDEASVSVDNLSNDILIAKPDENSQEDDVMIEIENTQKVPRLEEKDSDDLQGFVNKLNEKLDDGDEGEHIAFTESDHVKRKDQDHVDCNGEEDELPKCSMLLSHDMDDREKMLLEEYTSTLEKFKELKQRLKETEKQNHARSFKSLVQIKILRKANDSKDAEIRSLCEKIKFFETNIGNHDELDKTTDVEITKASNDIDEGTHRIEELVETDHFEVQNSKEDDETVDSDDEGTQTSRELDVSTSFEQKKTRVDEDHEITEIEEEIRAEIEHFRKENLELWLRFCTSYHQINRFQDSFNDLVQEIKQVEEKKQDRGSGKLRYRHSQSALDIRSIYRHMRDMQTEVVLWLEKNELLEDDLQHRLTSLCDIENELSDLTNVQLNNYQAAKFQGEVLNMKQENVKVINELREACERVQTLQYDIDKTLSMLDEELGRIKKSGFSSKVPFKSILFGSKLRKKHKHSMFTRGTAHYKNSIVISTFCHNLAKKVDYRILY